MRLQATALMYVALLAIGLMLVLALLLVPDNRDVEADTPHVPPAYAIQQPQP
jgi:hypothetical protein